MARDKVDIISSTDFQRGIGATVDNVRNNKKVVVIQSHGRDQVAMLPVDRYRELLVKEREADAARMARIMGSVPDQQTNIQNSN
jgi:PHD/YefM family antitoxin component YafN of YafNO toxin-antitoxin module